MAAFFSCDRPNLIPSRGQSCTRLIKLQDLLDGSNVPGFSSANSLVLSWHEHQITFKRAGFEPCLISACVRSSNLKWWQPPCHAELTLKVKDRMAWGLLPENRRIGGKANLCLTSSENVCWQLKCLRSPSFTKSQRWSQPSAEDFRFSGCPQSLFLKAKDVFTCQCCV